MTEGLELLSEQVGKTQDRIYNTTGEKLRKIYIKILQIAEAATIAMILISVLLSLIEIIKSAQDDELTEEFIDDEALDSIDENEQDEDIGFGDMSM